MRSRLGMPLKATTDYDTGKLLIRYSYEMIRDVSDLQKVVTFGASL